jgi:peptide deformylase
MSNLIRKRSTRVSAVLSTAAVSLGLFAGPASAQPVQVGLINVNLSNNDVAVGVGVAANICGVQANVLAQDIQQDGEANCTNDIDGTVTTDRPGNPNA